MIIQNGENYTTIIADDGMMLQRNDIIRPMIMLGCNDRPEYWNEITLEEAERLQAEQEYELDPDLIFKDLE